MKKLFAPILIALLASAAAYAEPPKATPAVPAQPAPHEAGKPMEPPKAQPATPAEPSPKAMEHGHKGKHKGRK